MVCRVLNNDRTNIRFVISEKFNEIEGCMNLEEKKVLVSLEKSGSWEL